MTIECTQVTVTYQGGSDVRIFPIPFPVLNKTDLNLSACDNSGIGIVMVEGIDYEWEVKRDEKRNITSIWLRLKQPLPAGWRMTLQRVLPLTQECAFTNQGPYLPKTMEECLDRGIMIAQQLDNDIRNVEGTTARVDALTRNMNDRLADHQVMLANLEESKASRRELTSLDARVDTVVDACDALSSHAGRHHTGGEDAITPASIGALGAEHASASDPHPQYMLCDENTRRDFFQYDDASLLLLWRATVAQNLESGCWKVFENGLLIWKGTNNG